MCFFLVREAGLEPARPQWTLEPESSESERVPRISRKNVSKSTDKHIVFTTLLYQILTKKARDFWCFPLLFAMLFTCLFTKVRTKTYCGATTFYICHTSSVDLATSVCAADSKSHIVHINTYTFVHITYESRSNRYFSVFVHFAILDMFRNIGKTAIYC